ncbi:DMT family transporter [Massilia sp. PAMC28688]|uniref:DMT family transporter n=1 Tax=Massilia sp. PAMC28688 TaxID=2861283 RepID=UPI001C636D6F|nr:DMT family transporter [Massilia sp. PAMC28688]QYF94460.1 DMT family transporter [Massilia sp. PAMC28688]
MSSLWMLFASFMFSAMGAGVKLASTLYSTSEIVMYRGLVGTIGLLILVRLQRGSLRTAFAGAHLWRAFVGVVSLWLWFYAIAKLPLATAVTLNYMAPIWMAFFLFCAGWWRAKDHVEWPLLAAIALSFVGVILVLQPAAAADQWLGGLVGLLSSILSALAYMQVRKLGQLGEPEYRVVFYFSLMTVVAGAFGTMLESRAPGAPVFTPHTGYGLWLLLAIGVSATAAQMAMTRAYRVGRVLVVANLQYTGIIFSSLWGMFLWSDRFNWYVWLGMGVILISGIAATFYNTRSSPRGAAVTSTDPIASEA